MTVRLFSNWSKVLASGPLIDGFLLRVRLLWRENYCYSLGVRKKENGSSLYLYRMNFEPHVSFALEAAYLLHQAKTATKPPREKRKLDHIIMTYWSKLVFSYWKQFQKNEAHKLRTFFIALFLCGRRVPKNTSEETASSHCQDCPTIFNDVEMS